MSATYKGYGLLTLNGAENLVELTYPKPVPGERQLLVRVHAASVNPVDWKLAAGYGRGMVAVPEPAIFGMDAAGVVEAAGAGVSRFAVGDRVMGDCFASMVGAGRGSFAEYVLMDEPVAVKIPELLSFEEAAAVPLAGLTAWQCLAHGSLSAGSSVLLNTGAGAVGIYALQFAKQHYGAKVAMVASAANHEYLRSLGADVLIDRRTVANPSQAALEAFGGKRFDLVLDAAGAGSQHQLVEVLAPGKGVFTSIIPSDEPSPERAKELGVKVVAVWTAPAATQDLQSIADLIGAKKVVIPKLTKFAMTDARTALLRSKEGSTAGKIVLSW